MKHAIAFPEPTPAELMEQLRVSHAVVAMEAMAGTEGMKQALARLPLVYDKAKTFYAKFLGNVGGFMFDSKNLRDMSFNLERYSYADSRQMDVLVPEGLNSDLLTYVQTLQRAGLAASRIEVDVLTPFEKWLATMLGRPSELAALTQNIKIPEMRLHNIDQDEKLVQTCFVHSGRRESIVPFGKAFKRNSDVAVLAVELEKLENQFNKDTQKRVVQLVNRISEMTGELIICIEQDPKQYAASPAAIAAMSQICYQVARELEHYGLYRYRLTELASSIEETRKKIGTWLNYKKLN